MYGLENDLAFETEIFELLSAIKLRVPETSP